MPTPGEHLRGRRVALLCHNAGWRDEKLLIAVAIAGAESGWYPEAYHDNDDGSRDRGLFQINTVHDWLSDADAYKAGPNTEAAYRVYKDNGYSFEPWAAYTNAAYLKWIRPAARGVANMWLTRYHVDDYL